MANYPIMPDLPWAIIGKGFMKSPKFNTIRQKTAGGYLATAALQPFASWVFELDLNFITGDEETANTLVNSLVGLYNQVAGGAGLFLFHDPNDDTVTNALFGVGDGVTNAFQLSRPLGGSTDVLQNATVASIAINGTTADPSTYTVSPTGVVTFTSTPTVGQLLTWSGTFLYLVVFSEDTLGDLARVGFNTNDALWNISSIKLESVFAAGAYGAVIPGAGGGGGGISGGGAGPSVINAVVTNPGASQTILNWPLALVGLDSQSSHIANSGFLSLGNTDTIAWRNAGNTLDLALGVNSNNQLVFGSEPVLRGNVFNVLDFGADPTGSADSATAFQNTINAAVSATGMVFVPAGTFKIGTALTDASGLQGFYGEGQTSKLQVPNSSSTNQIINFTNITALGFKFRGIQYSGPGQSTSNTQIGVTLSNSGGNIEGADVCDNWFTGWSNYCLDVEAPIETEVHRNRFLNSQKGALYNGGTSVKVYNNYGLNITKVVHDIVGTDYASWEDNAADACGLELLVRGTVDVLAIRDCGHERGTASNVTVTNVALTTLVATVTYTGTDLSADWVSGMTVVIAGTTSTSGLFNGRVVPTSVTSSTIVYPLNHADVSSASDSGTASLFAGDGIETSGSIAGLSIDGFYGTSAQQTTSSHVVLAGTVSAGVLDRLVSTLGSGGSTPSTQSIDLYIGLNCANLFRFNTNLLGGVTNLGSQGQQISNNSWTVGNIVSNSGTPASSGKIRLNDAETLSWRNNGNSADLPLGISANDFLTFNSLIVPQRAVASVNLTGQTAAISTTNLIASVPVSGRYLCVHFSKVTTVDTTSSTLGGSGGLQIGATSPTDSVAYTTQAGHTSTGNLTSSNVQDSIVAFAKAGTALTYKMGYTAGTGNMAYETHIDVFYLGA